LCCPWPRPSEGYGCCRKPVSPQPWEGIGAQPLAGAGHRWESSCRI